jgi:hypothetical protein
MKTLLLLALAAFPLLSAAQERNDGTTWHMICNQGTSVDRAICDMFVYGYLEGVRVQAGFANFRSPFCTPKSTTIAQATGVFAKYLADHPESRHLPVATLLTQARPCR